MGFNSEFKGLKRRTVQRAPVIPCGHITQGFGVIPSMHITQGFGVIPQGCLCSFFEIYLMCYLSAHGNCVYEFVDQVIELKVAKLEF
jgi:hypothetical protein